MLELNMQGKNKKSNFYTIHMIHLG
ncbi:hypothetical protein CH1034_250117 [Klebsiella pneumoniae]|nr:hypothetical protein CH1034_250117 [Klebsiella pneumoniae]